MNSKNILVVLGVVMNLSLCAFDRIWHGVNGNNWSGENWDAGGLFEAGDSAIFNATYGAGPFEVEIDTDVDAAKISVATDTSIIKPATVTPIAYYQFRFKVEAVKGSEDLMQLSELKLYSGETDITSQRSDFRYDTERYDAGRDYNGYPYPAGESPEKLVDGELGTKWLDSRTTRSDETTKNATWVVLTYAEPQTVTKYEWYTANDSPGRDPGSWRLQGSNDGMNWRDLDVVVGYSCTDDRQKRAYSKTLDYAANLKVSEIDVAEGATLTLGVAPKSAFTKTGTGTVKLLDGLSLGFTFAAGGLDLNGLSYSVTKSILQKDAAVIFLNGTYQMDANEWNFSDDATPSSWIIGRGAVFEGARRLVLSPDGERDCNLVIRDGGKLTTSGSNNYIQNHDHGKTVIEITGAGSMWDCGNEIYMIPSNDFQCENPRADLRVTDGATLKMGARLSWGQKNTKFAVNPEGYMLVSNATVTISDCMDFGIKSDQTWNGSAPLEGGYYKAEFLDGAQITAQRIFVGRERKNVEVRFDGATFTSRANSSDFLMQDRRDDMPFVVTGRGLTVNTLHNTVLKARFRGEGDFVKKGGDKIDVYDDQYFTGTLVCEEGTINNLAGRNITFAASGLAVKGGTVNFSTVDFTNETFAVALNAGTLHLFNNGKIEEKNLSSLTLGAGVSFRFDVSADGVDQFVLSAGDSLTNNATAESPVVFAPTILSGLPVNEPYTLISRGFTEEDLTRVKCTEEGYVLGVTEAGALTITHQSETRVYAGGVEVANWSDAIWGTEEEKENFINGDNATFANDGDQVHLDVPVTVGEIRAEGDATITYTAEDNTPKYKRFRFCIDATKSNNDMMQLAEIELYNFAQKLNPDSVAYDSSAHGLDKPYPDGEKPDYAVDGSLDKKWLDYRGGNGRTDEQKAACYLEFVYENPVYVTKYSWYTANDEQGRDPYSWRLLAFDETAGEAGAWITLDQKVRQNVTEVRKALAGTWEIAYQLPETPSLKISEAIDVAEGKTLRIEAPITTDFAKTGAGRLVITQPLTGAVALNAGGLDLAGGALSFGDSLLTADSVIGFYNGTFTYNASEFAPGARMPREWTIGAGALLTGGVSSYLSINTPEDDEDYTLRLDGGAMKFGSSTSWLNSNSTGLFNLVLTNNATADFGGKVYAVASNEQILEKAQIALDISSGSVFKTGGHLTFGRESSQHAKELKVDVSVREARLELGGNLDIGADNSEDNRRAGYYHFYFGPNSVLQAIRLITFDDRDDTSVVFDGATMVSTRDEGWFIARDKMDKGESPFTIAAGGLTVSNEHAITIPDTLKGEGGLVKTGSGLLTIGADQAFTGPLTIAGPVNLAGHSLAGGVVLAEGGKLEVDFDGSFPDAGFPLDVKSIEMPDGQLFPIEINYSSPLDVNSSYKLFTGVSEGDEKKIQITGLDLRYSKGSIYGDVNPSTRIWSGVGGDAKMTTGDNWTDGVAPRGYDSAIFPLAEGGVVTNDNATTPALLLVNTLFPENAGAFTFEGNPMSLWCVSNESRSVQTYLNRITANGESLTVDVADEGKVAFEGGLSFASSARPLVKTGAGELTIKGEGPHARLQLDGGTVQLTNLAESAKNNPFATGSGEIALSGTLDLGGATQEVKLSTTSGETFAHAGMKLLNGTIKLLKTENNKYFEPTGDIEIGQGGNLRIEAEDGPIINLARGDANKHLKIVCRDGGKLYSHSKQESVYLASGGGVKEVEIQLENGGFYHADNAYTHFGRSGNTIRLYGNGGKMDLNRLELVMVATGGARASVNLTNGWIKASRIAVGEGWGADRPAVAEGEFNFIGGSLDLVGFKVRNVARFHARLENVNFDPYEDTDNYFNVDDYLGEEPPFELAGAPCRFKQDHKIGIKTTLVGDGGLTVEKGTLTLAADQAYTGATTVKSGATLNAVGMKLNGPLVVESGATLVRPELGAAKYVRILQVREVSGDGVTLGKKQDDAGNKYFMRGAWLCYGKPDGMVISIR